MNESGLSRCMMCGEIIGTKETFCTACIYDQIPIVWVVISTTTGKILGVSGKDQPSIELTRRFMVEQVRGEDLRSILKRGTI